MEQNTFQHYLIGLLAIGNNITALGAFLAHTRGLSAVRVKRMIAVTSAASLAMLLLFMVVGTAVLDFFGISISAFQIAGGLLLAGLGSDMLKSRQPADVALKAVALPPGEVDDAHLLATAVVPIAIPLTVGAGTFSAVILFADLAEGAGRLVDLTAAIAVLVVVNAAVFSGSARILRLVGEVGLSVFTKIMGLFTLAIGVEFVLRGLAAVVVPLLQG